MLLQTSVWNMEAARSVETSVPIN